MQQQVRKSEGTIRVGAAVGKNIKTVT